MTLLQWFAAGAAAAVATLGARRLFAASSTQPPVIVTTPADLAAAPSAWTATDYASFLAAARRLGVHPADALLFIGNESNYKPSAAFRKDDLIYAAGLNQITKAGSAALGVKPENAQAYLNQLVTLSVGQQIPIVERSLAAGLHGANVVGRPENVGVLYAVNFLPQRVRERGTAPDTVLTTKGEGYYDQNHGLDFDKDGRITIRDLSDYLKATILPRLIFRGALAKLRAAADEPTMMPRFV